MLKNQTRLLGISLIIGGLLVGFVIIWLATIYATDGTTPTLAAIAGGLLGIVLLTLPQVALGLYMLFEGQADRK